MQDAQTHDDGRRLIAIGDLIKVYAADDKDIQQTHFERKKDT